MSQPMVPTAWMERLGGAGDRPTREVLLLSLPIGSVMAGQVLMAFVNNSLVARLGTAELAAVTLPGLLGLAVITLAGGPAAAVSTRVSAATGRGDPTAAGAALWHGLTLAALLLPVSALLALLAPSMFAALSPADPVLAELQTDYFCVRVWGCPTAVGTLAVAGFFQGRQRPAALVAPMLASNAANLLANYGLIFGHFGLPALGLTGAALATVAGSLFQFGWLLLLALTGSTAAECQTRQLPKLSTATLREIGRLARLGLPTTLEKFLEFAGWGALLAVLAVRFGRTDLAVGTIVLQWLSVGFMPVVGIALAVAATTGYRLGRGEPDAVAPRVWAGMRLGLVHTLALSAVLVLAGQDLVAVFSDDPAVIATGTRVLTVVAISQWASPIGLVLAGSLRGAGDTLGVAGVMFRTNTLVLVPTAVGLAWVTPADCDSPLVWSAVGVYTAASSIALWRRFRAGHWRTALGITDFPPTRVH